MNAEEFISEAGGHGACVGIVDEKVSDLIPPAGFELRTISGSRVKSRDGVFDAFAEVWHFPPWFGRNMDAFDDFMRDLDKMTTPQAESPLHPAISLTSPMRT